MRRTRVLVFFFRKQFINFFLGMCI